ncbi:hypothetical protein FB547_103310 [Variovorax beijingensis]|uniref:Uncharacterized protein n=2 Tax=Variovorax beijingensis TaxID=2496117 RepID=A0A561C8E0_9BURK|nr:hypothetical protein FB547_103310 [Variovorax beijingensis]
MLSFLVAKVVLVPIGQWYEMSKAQSFDDVSDAFVLSLLCKRFAPSRVAG